MSALNCKICFKPFDSAAVQPRILPCGHTCCSLCIGQILTTAMSCPLCRKSLSELNVEQYPINYSILEISEEFSDSPYNVTNFLKRLKLTSEKHHKVVAFADDAITKAQNVLEHMVDVATMKGNAKKLLDLIPPDPDDCSFNAKEANGNLEAIERTMNAVIEIFCWEENYPDITNFKINTRGFKGDDWSKFFMKVEKSQLNDQKFAALLRIDGLTKVARLSISEGYLCIHSFEELQDNHDFITICFQDLLKELMTGSSTKDSPFCTFFDFKFRSGVFPRKVIVKVKDPTLFISNQFIKLCTGQIGRSYKNFKYVQNYGEEAKVATGDTFVIDFIIQILNFGFINKDSDIYTRHFTHKGKQEPKAFLDSEVCYLEGFKKGAFNIFCHKYETELSCENRHIIGQIVDFNGDLASIFKDATERSILDCGLAFKFGV